MTQVLDTNKQIGNEEFKIEYEDLILASSGILDNGSPASMATIMVDKISESGEQVADMQITMQSAVLHFFYSGGCLVAQVDFPKTATAEYNRTAYVLSTFMEKSGQPEYLKDHGFGMVIIPMAFYGQITIVAQDLVYFTGFDLPDGSKRLIMCFNDLATQVLQNDDIDYAEIEETVKQAAQREEAKLNDELNAVYAELEEVNKSNPYQEMIDEKLKQDIERQRQSDGTFDDGWIRSAKE